MSTWTSAPGHRRRTTVRRRQPPAPELRRISALLHQRQQAGHVRPTEAGRVAPPGPPMHLNQRAPVRLTRTETGASVRSVPRPRAATASGGAPWTDGRQVKTGIPLARRPLRAGQDIAPSAIRTSESREHCDDHPRPRACTLARIPAGKRQGPLQGSPSVCVSASLDIPPGAGGRPWSCSWRRRRSALTGCGTARRA